MADAPNPNGRNGGWKQQVAPWALAGSIGLGGTGAFTGVSQWQWIDENRPQFEKNTAEVAVLKQTVEHLQQHNVYQDLEIKELRAEKMDANVWRDRRDAGERDLRELSDRFNALESQLDIVQDRLRSGGTR